MILSLHVKISRRHSNASEIVSVGRWSCVVAKKDPFPNDWEEVFNMDESDLVSPPFVDVLEDSVIWHLPDPYCCIIRSYNRKDAKIKEYAYKQEGKARSKIKELADIGCELTLITQAYIGVLNYPNDNAT